jgi:predicted HNH restriction endonuclease
LHGLSYRFFARYGDIGKDFIECHHVIPVSELKPGMKTKLSDVVLVCSNCHRMLHRKRPWIRVDDLKALLKQ